MCQLRIAALSESTPGCCLEHRDDRGPESLDHELECVEIDSSSATEEVHHGVHFDYGHEKGHEVCFLNHREVQTQEHACEQDDGGYQIPVSEQILDI